MECRHSYIVHLTIVLHFETITRLKCHIDQLCERSDGPNETHNVPPSEVGTTDNFEILSSNDREPQPADTKPEFEPEYVAQENEENDTERRIPERIRNKPDRFIWTKNIL